MAGTWNNFTAPSGVAADTSILLTDGSVLVHDATATNDWYRLTPNGQGDYRNGSWSGKLSMATGRQFFGSGVLKDGRVFVVGGEYSTAGAQDTETTAEMFDPVTNTWSPITKPATVNFVLGDCCAMVLADGRVLFGAVTGGAQTAIWDPDTNDWQVAGTQFGTTASAKVGNCNEESWALLPNGNVLTAQISGATATQDAEMYVPSLDRWVSAGKTTQALVINSFGGATINEIGPGIALPDGRALFFGGTGRTCFYTPGATTTATGSWANGRNFPADSPNANSPTGLETVIDGACAVLPDGSVLATAGPTIKNAQNQFWSKPTRIYRYDIGANTLTRLTNQPGTAPDQTWMACMLVLPNGRVLLTGEQNTISEYTPDAAESTPDNAWKPRLTTAPSALIAGHSYRLNGKLLSGMTHGSGYGDDRQNNTNYPIARLTNAAGDVRYLRTHDFTGFGLNTGNDTHSFTLEVPPATPPGAWTLQVVVNGIASDPLNVTVGTRDCFLIMDRSTVSEGEVRALLDLGPAPAVINPAVLVVVEGYTPAELGLTPGNLNAPPVVPAVTSTDGITLNRSGPVLPEDPALPANQPQRLTFQFDLRFPNANAFGFAPATKDVGVVAQVTAGGQSVANAGVLSLVKSPTPYILDGLGTTEVPWFTSIDMRVLQVRAGVRRFGATLATSGAQTTVATAFIQQVLTNLNDPTHPTLGAEFDAIPAGEQPESLTLSPTDPDGTRVFNFALARVRLRDLTADAPDVKVFFRMWPAQQTNAVHDTATLYRTFSGPAGKRIPLLGKQGDEIATIPFFASPRVDTTTLSMKAQTDSPNVRTIHHDSLGAETYAYFGCWLDINQPGQKHFPNRLIGSQPANLPDGPYVGTPPRQSIQDLVKSFHQCLIAEVEIAGQSIPSTADPSTSDKLAQRNLTFVGVPNPGVDASRMAPQPLQVRARELLGPDGRPDELVIDWGNVPDGTTATLFLPSVPADRVLEWARQLYLSNRLTKVDEYTIGCAAAGLTFVPVPPGSELDHVGLIALELPGTVHKGDRYEVSVRQVTGAHWGKPRIQEGQRVVRGKVARGAAAAPVALAPAQVTRGDGQAVASGFDYRRTAGAFGLVVPVSTKGLMLATEQRTLSILRSMARSVPFESRWFPVMSRYLDVYVGRVSGMGGDPTVVRPSADGDWKHPKDDAYWDDFDHGEHDHHHHHDGDHHHGSEHGHDSRGCAEVVITGKVASLQYDHFGDFTGFVVEDECDRHHHVRSTEERVQRLADQAWRERLRVRCHLHSDGVLEHLAVSGRAA